MTKLFLFDIEGTTTDINFVHKVLFPYSRDCIEEFVRHHKDEKVISEAIRNVQETVKVEDGLDIDLNGAVATLLKWIKDDRKHGALKEIQGHIWDIGYSKNDFKGHVYDDVKLFFMKVLESGNKIGIYSSGSVHAQKLIFGYSSAGDLTPLISYYFDTKIGGKKEKESYFKISEITGFPSENIYFFSDIPDELKAAMNAGFNVIQVLRPGTNPSEFEGIPNFNEATKYL